MQSPVVASGMDASITMMVWERGMVVSLSERRIEDCILLMEEPRSLIKKMEEVLGLCSVTVTLIFNGGRWYFLLFFFYERERERAVTLVHPRSN